MAGGEPLPKPGAAHIANLPVDWQAINVDLQDDVHQQLSSHSVSISAAEETFVTITVSLLSRNNLLKEKRPGISPCGPHRLSSVEKMAQRMAKTKSSLRRTIADNPRPFHPRR